MRQATIAGNVLVRAGTKGRPACASCSRDSLVVLNNKNATAMRWTLRCMSEQVHLAQDGFVTRITMNRPSLHNAFNELVIADLTRAFEEAARSAAAGSTRVVVFTGAGRSFSAGADLAWMKKMATYTHAENEADALLLFQLFLALKKCPVPVVARVNGAAVGGGGRFHASLVFFFVSPAYGTCSTGAGLVAASDISVALESAQFGFTEVKLGLIPAVISPFVIERIGTGNAYRYFLTGERFGSKEAAAIGLVQETVATEQQLDARVEQIAAEVAANSPAAVARCKKLIQAVSKMSYLEDSTRRFVAGEIAGIRVSAEGQEGLR